MKVIKVSFIVLLLTACSSTNGDNAATLNDNSLKTQLSYYETLKQIDESFISAIVEKPNINGALGRNQVNYFHVRFQMNMNRISDYALFFKNSEALEIYNQVLTYSFNWQNPKGDFEFVVPDDIGNNPSYIPPSEADLLSGTAFFAYSVGLGLLSLNQSDWYISDVNKPFNTNIENKKEQYILLLEYLKANSTTLLNYDENAPNRLFIDAFAYYSLGSYLNDSEALSIAVTFINKALTKQNKNDGYFIEGGGFDSSYNGVTIKIAFELFLILSNNIHYELKQTLGNALISATEWQKSRVLESGEISTEGNTRVYSGGESFIGKPKQVDVLKTVKAFYYMAILANNNEYKEKARLILKYYNK